MRKYQTITHEGKKKVLVDEFLWLYINANHAFVIKIITEEAIPEMFVGDSLSRVRALYDVILKAQVFKKHIPIYISHLGERCNPLMFCGLRNFNYLPTWVSR